MKKDKFLFIVRAYNEVSRVWIVIQALLDAWFSEICVVNDGSKDETQKVLNSFWNKIYSLRHPINRGAGAALETGFEFARRYSDDYNWEYIVTFDADGQHDIADIHSFFQILHKNPGTQVIFWSRFIQKTRSNVPLLRRIVLYLGMIFTKCISQVHLTDAHNGYRLIKIEVVNSIRLTMDGMEYASELIDQINKLWFHIHEVPVNIHYDSYTLGKGQRHGWMFRIAFKMVMNKFFL